MRSTHTLIVLTVVVGAIFAGLANSAFAATPALTGNSNTHTVLAQFNPGGVLAAGDKVLYEVQIPAGRTIYNSGKNRAGQRVWYQYTVKLGDRFVMTNHGLKKWNCDNDVRVGSKPSGPIATNVVMVAKFDIHVNVHVDVHLTKTHAAKPKGPALCTGISVQKQGLSVAATATFSSAAVKQAVIFWSWGDKTSSQTTGKTGKHKYSSSGFPTIAATAKVNRGKSVVKLRCGSKLVSVTGSAAATAPAAAASAPNGAAAAASIGTSQSNGVSQKCGTTENCNNNAPTAQSSSSAIAQSPVNIGCLANCGTSTTTPPAPPVNHPPTITFTNAPQHVFVTTNTANPSRVLVCAKADDPDGDAVIVSFSAVYGSFGSNVGDPQGRNDVYCNWYTAPTLPATAEVITATVVDSKGAKSDQPATATFPVVKDQF